VKFKPKRKRIKNPFIADPAYKLLDDIEEILNKYKTAFDYVLANHGKFSRIYTYYKEFLFRLIQQIGDPNGKHWIIKVLTTTQLSKERYTIIRQYLFTESSGLFFNF
jgi:hypothetical protein